MIPPTPPKSELGSSPAPDELEAARFVARLRSTRPIASYTILAVLAAIFVLEVLLGGADVPSPTLAHMGANVVERTRAGELERILSASMLHAHPLHAGMNLYVLFALGRVMEALVGRARFLVLYVAAAIGGGLGTTFLSSAELSVGASGAMWGLLGAMGMLAFRPSGLVPARALPGWRRMAMTNLGLNVLVSFSPGIDLWAHLGGGIAGALLVGSGALTAGLSLAEPPSRSRFTGAHAAIAGVGCVVLVLALGVAWWRGRPWELATGPAYARRGVPELGLSVDIPVLLPSEVSAAPTAYGAAYSIGDIPFDPYVVFVSATPRSVPEPDVAARAAMLAAPRSMIDAFDPQDGAMALGPPMPVSPGGHPGVERSWRYANGLVYHRIVLVAPSHDLLLEVVAWEAYDGSLAVAEHVAGSIAPL